MFFGGIIGWRKTEKELEAKTGRFSGAPHAETEKSPFAFYFCGKRRGIFKTCPEPLVKAVFFFLVQEKSVFVRITSEGPSRENRLEEII